MNLQAAKTSLNEARSQLAAIQSDLQKKQTEHDEAQQAHARRVAATAGRQRYPKSLQVQRESLLRLKMEIEGLESANAIAEQEVADAKKQRDLATLHEKMVKPYHQAESAFIEKYDEITKAITQLNEKAEAFSSMVNGFLAHQENPLAILSRLVSHTALTGLSLREFFDGEIAQATAQENGNFIEETVSKYVQISNRLPEFNTVENSWITLSDYLQSLSRQANALVPREVKYLTEETAPTPDARTQKGRVLPRNLYPDTSEDERPIKRVKVIDANRVISEAPGIQSNV